MAESGRPPHMTGDGVAARARAKQSGTMAGNRCAMHGCPELLTDEMRARRRRQLDATGLRAAQRMPVVGQRNCRPEKHSRELRTNGSLKRQEIFRSDRCETRV